VTSLQWIRNPRQHILKEIIPGHFHKVVFVKILRSNVYKLTFSSICVYHGILFLTQNITFTKLQICDSHWCY